MSVDWGSFFAGGFFFAGLIAVGCAIAAWREGELRWPVRFDDRNSNIVRVDGNRVG